MEAFQLGIRGKLVLLALGIAVPLVLFSAIDLRSMWRLSRAQLDDSLKQQVELAAIVLGRWLDDQTKALAAIAALADDADVPTKAASENLQNVLRTRPFWLDLRINNAEGNTVVSQPDRVPLPSALADHVASRIREGDSWAVTTDRTVDEARPTVIIAVPTANEGAVIARIDGTAINELFRGIDLPPEAVISVLDADGRVLFRRRGSDMRMEADVSWATLASTLETSRTNVVELTSPIDGIRRVYGVSHIRQTGLIAMIGIPSSHLYEPASQRFNRYALIALIALSVAVGAALIISQSIVLPVRRLRAVAQRLGAGNLNARAPVTEVGEIGDLAAAFNSMAARIEEREERLNELDRLKSEFVSSVSHELKTPLTTIKILAHLLHRPSVSEEERVDYARTIATECDRQIDFVGNLLDVSRIEAGAYYVETSLVEVGDSIRSAVEAERYRAESAGIVLRMDVPDSLPRVQVDVGALTRILRGLIDNSIKYTAAGGQVSVSAIVAGERIAIAVEDSGRGISTQDLPHIFEKFYRAEGSAVEDEGGHSGTNETAASGVGLGLYLARYIIEQFGGEITVESEVMRGTTFTLLLPFACSQKPDLAATDADVETPVNR
ncbi:MAG TPA: ATP-binding protein [Pyrinomonadaceae bacterium]|nr:ATP-binding protein [Pyrinomonadaceae bacterium]